MIPDINQRQYDHARFDDGTPQKSRNIGGSYSVNQTSMNNSDGGFLPQISTNAGSMQNSQQNTFNNRRKTRAPEKRDFFKLVTVDKIEYEQNDQTLKEFYANRLMPKKVAQSATNARYRHKLKGGKAKSISFETMTHEQRSQFANLATNYKQFVADQKHYEPEDLWIQEERKQGINKLKEEIKDDFDVSTQYDRSGSRKTLFNVVMQNQEAKIKVQSPELVLAKQTTEVKKRFPSSHVKRTAFMNQKGRISSSQHLLALNQKESVNKTDADTSALYIPEMKRQFKNKELKIKETKMMNVITKKVQFDMEKSIQQLADEQAKTLKKKRKKAKEETVKKRVKRRASFSEGQMKYDDVRLLRNPLRERTGPSLKDQVVIEKMKKQRRYPIPERLVNVPDDFMLFIDSVITQAYNSDENEAWTNYKQETQAPCNSWESQEEVDFQSSSGSEADMLPAPTNRKEKEQAKKRTAKITKQAMNLHGFEMDQLRAYPNQQREGEFPMFLLHESLKEDFDLLKKRIIEPLKTEFKEKKIFPTFEHLQLTYETFCQEFLTQPLILSNYYSTEINKEGVLTFKGTSLPEQQIKAICCVIPLIAGLTEVAFINNHLNDEMAPAIFFACFQNPDLKKITIVNNFLRASASNTWAVLNDAFPDKIYELNISGSIHVGDHGDNFTRCDTKVTNLQTLNLSNIAVSLKTTYCIQQILIHGQILKNLNLANCRTSYQSTRYIIEGVNRNQGLQYLNLSMNNLSSSKNEFSVTMAKVLTRHQQIMHVDLTQTQLQKEEVLFIGMAISCSKSCIAIHLTANGLDYYERIFLRTLINARTSYHFRNNAQETGSIRSQKERNQIQELKNHDFDHKDLKEFVKQWNYIDSQRLGIDEEINKILADIDITEIFKKLKKKDKSGVENSSAVQDLIEKIQIRMEELQEMKDQEPEEEEEEKVFEAKDLDGHQTLTEFKGMGFVNKDDQGPKAARDLKEGDDDGKNIWAEANEFKNERVKQKIDIDNERQKRAKSAGEMALKFMGINKIAYDLLLENPMTGYMNEIILSRVLGSDDIEDEFVWFDCSQCFVCEKWNKTKIEFNDNDFKTMKQSIKKLDDLHQVLKECVDLQLTKLVKKVPASKVKEMYPKQKEPDEEDLLVPQGQLLQQGQVAEEIESENTLTADKIYTESMNSDEYMDNQDVDIDKGNTINVVKVDKYRLQKQLPQNLHFPENMANRDHESEQMSSESSIEKYKDLLTPEPEVEQSQHSQEEEVESVDISEEEKKMEEQEAMEGEDEEENLDVEGKRRRKKTPPPQRRGAILGFDDRQGTLLSSIPEARFRLVKRTIFFQGMAYMVEEEVSIHSSEDTSVRTSEDSYSTDNSVVKSDYNKRLRLKAAERTDAQKAEIELLQKTLDKNRMQHEKNHFGRANVFLVASFADWQPIQMHTYFECKTKKTKKWELMEWLDKQKASQQTDVIKSKKKEENQVMFTDFIPPGKHFFYFIYKKEHVFLSPKYDVVRFKGTNVFLNQIVVKERVSELQQVTLDRKYDVAEQAVFIKERSVFKTFLEDTDDYLKKMLEQDLAYGKISRMTKKEEDAKAVKEMLLKYYMRIKNIFLHIASTSQYPCMGLNDFTIFCHRSQLFDKAINLATVDRTFIQTNYSNNPYKNSAERELHRYEFVEIVTRLGEQKYKATKICENLQDSVQKILEEHIIPYNQSHMVDGYNFRIEHMYNLKVDEIFKKNEIVLKAFFEKFLTPNKKYINLEEITTILKQADLKIHENRINPCYAESMMSKIDTMSDLSSLEQMKYVEFLVFIARVSHEIYKGHPKEHWGCHLKIDRVMDSILSTQYMTKMWGFKDEFEEEEGSGSESGGSDDKGSKMSGSGTDSDNESPRPNNQSPGQSPALDGDQQPNINPSPLDAAP